jgi:drug/metabolite transporter (DMT)-like permease
MAALANVAPYLLFSWSEQRISAGLAGALSGATPLLTLLLAHAFGVGRLTVARVFGLVLGLVGVVLLAAPWHDETRAVSLPGVLPRWGQRPASPALMYMRGACSPIGTPSR